MKKVSFVLTILLLLTMILTSCEVFLPDVTTEPDCVMHIWSEYKHNERGHWREYTCGCPWPENFEEHINHDTDMLCDVCGALYECKHVDEDKNDVCDNCGIEFIVMVWQHTETHHWMIYYSPVGNPVPEVVWNEGEHVDENGDGACDICEYQMR